LWKIATEAREVKALGFTDDEAWSDALQKYMPEWVNMYFDWLWTPSARRRDLLHFLASGITKRATREMQPVVETLREGLGNVMEEIQEVMAELQVRNSRKNLRPDVDQAFHGLVRDVNGFDLTSEAVKSIRRARDAELRDAKTKKAAMDAAGARVFKLMSKKSMNLAGSALDTAERGRVLAKKQVKHMGKDDKVALKGIKNQIDDIGVGYEDVRADQKLYKKDPRMLAIAAGPEPEVQSESDSGSGSESEEVEEPAPKRRRHTNAGSRQ
jgi:hypothetical protein